MSFLPGMFPGSFGSNAAFDLTFIGYAESYSSSVDISSLSAGEIAAGDLCLFFNRAAGSTPNDVQPSGFTQLISDVASGIDCRAQICAKRLTGSESTLNGYNSATGHYILALIFRPSLSFSSFTFHSGGAASTQIVDYDPSSQLINSSAATTIPVLAFGQMGSSLTIDPRTVSPAMDELGSVNNYVHYKIYNIGDTPVDHSYDMDDEGSSNTLQSGYLTFS